MRLVQLTLLRDILYTDALRTHENHCTAAAGGLIMWCLRVSLSEIADATIIDMEKEIIK